MLSKEGRVQVTSEDHKLRRKNQEIHFLLLGPVCGLPESASADKVESRDRTDLA